MNVGTALGVDRMITDSAVIGVSGGYAFGKVNSDINSATTAINSAQCTLYSGYQDENLPFFIDAAGSFAWNWYNGKRDVTVGTIGRTAKAEYTGQQYGLYLGGGYSVVKTDNFALTPLASLQWSHLRLGSYTETEADSMNLTASSQSYNLLQSGLGAKASYFMEFESFAFTPEIHGKWLYDFIGDNMTITSAFTGGGAAFDAKGVKPAQSSFNFGGSLNFDFYNDFSLAALVDTELKEQFFAIYGSLLVRYVF